MNLQNINPWNWFAHEEPKQKSEEIIPAKREDYTGSQLATPPVQQLHREIDRLFDEAFRGFGFPAFNRPALWDRMLSEGVGQTFRANLNVESDDHQYTVTLEAPGLEQEDLSIDLKERMLVIKGNKREETEDKDKQYYRIERRYGAFERVLSVPDDADVEGINASMKNGLLTINIPRQEVDESKVKKITID